jgi:5'-nucleotidase
VSGHTHQAYNCRIGDKLVTSAGAYGRVLTEIELRIGPAITAKAANHLVRADLAPDPAQAQLLARYGKLAEPLERVVGRLSAPLSRDPNADGESLLGRVVADSYLEATRGAGAVVAFMNAGTVRAPLQPGKDGAVTFADVYATYPFPNTLITMSLTGTQILRLLEQQWLRGDFGNLSLLQVSRGLRYAWDPKRPPGSRVVPGSVTLDGKALDPDAVYRVTVNDFMASGGGGLDLLREGRNRKQGSSLSARDALLRYLEEHSPLAPLQDRRVRRTD